jgi:anaerobic dimethyl sulfoxide reductase subunit C (anchor subunit)
MASKPVSSNWPLVFFTVLTQAAAGMALFSALFRFAALGAEDPVRIEEVIGPALLLVPGLIVIGALTAVLHLARVGAARFALGNLRSSWLSREVLLGLLFGATVAVQAVLHRLAPGATAARAILDVVASLLGLALVHAIGRIYMIRTVPAWNTWMTPAAFHATTSILGAAFFTSATAITTRLTGPLFDLLEAALAITGALVVLTVAFQVVLANRHFNRFPPRNGVGGYSHREQRAVLAVRIGFGLLGALFLFALVAWGAWSRLRVAATLSDACLLLFMGEVIGRFLFYASYRRTGL